MEEINSSIEKHVEWTEYINQRLEVIYKEICEYEKIINLQDEKNQHLSLLELLERINELHETAKNLSPVSKDLERKTVDLNQQIADLQNTMELLKLEKPEISLQHDETTMGE